MLELKPNELLVGSGDGSVCLVLDKSGQSGQNRRKSDGITRQLNEPTQSCLQEVLRTTAVELEWAEIKPKSKYQSPQKAQ